MFRIHINTLGYLIAKMDVTARENSFLAGYARLSAMAMSWRQVQSCSFFVKIILFFQKKNKANIRYLYNKYLRQKICREKKCDQFELYQ
jgi:hypothetical protein